MAADLADIMEALGARLDTVAGLRGFGYSPDNPQTPCAFPLVPSIPSYRETMRHGTYVLQFRIALLTAAQLDKVGQHKLARYANPTGTSSVRAALEDGDKTLGGLVDDLVVDGFDSNGLEEVGIGSYYGGTFTVRIIASGA